MTRTWTEDLAGKCTHLSSDRRAQGVTVNFMTSEYAARMLHLQGQYQVAANKRLTIIADPQHLPKGTLQADIDEITRACTSNGGSCLVQITTPHGPMNGTLRMKSATNIRRRSFEGSLAFLPPT